MGWILLCDKIIRVSKLLISVFLGTDWVLLQCKVYENGAFFQHLWWWLKCEITIWNLSQCFLPSDQFWCWGFLVWFFFFSYSLIYFYYLMSPLIFTISNKNSPENAIASLVDSVFLPYPLLKILEGLQQLGLGRFGISTLCLWWEDLFG